MMRRAGELAANVLSRLPGAEVYDPEGLVDEFAFALSRELDYLREARNQESFRRAFAGDAGVRVPEVIWSRTAKHVLTMERFRGIKVDDLAALDAAGIDRHSLAMRATGLIFREIFDTGEFQADPHPGNLLVLADGAIGALDFGMVGRLDDFTQDCVLALLLGAVEGDVDQVLDALERLGLSVRPVHRPRIRRDVARLVESYRGQPLEAFSLSAELASIAGLFRRYRLRLPAELLLLVRTLTLAEGVGRHLDPSYVATAAAAPYLRQAMLRRASPNRWAPRAARSAAGAAALAADLPLRLERLLGRLERGEIEIGWRPEGIDPVTRALDVMVDRLALTILASAFVICASVLLLSTQAAGWDIWIARGLLGFGLLTIGALGVSLLMHFLQLLRRRT
jgi:ubiquinone biosynthesis protein